MIKILYLLSILYVSKAFDLCVVGASSGLGRELIYQSIKDRNKKVLGLSGIPYPICEPYRGNSYEDIKQMPEIKNRNLILDSYWSDIKDEYKNIIFCTSASAFEKDYSDQLTKKFLENLPESCKTISLVSAFGVGDSLNEGNIGIQIMEKVYLKDVYRAKNVQENLINSFNKDVKKFIYRPKALSYGNTFFESIPRFELADEILDNLIY